MSKRDRQTELLHQLWREAEVWRAGKVRRSDSLSWWAPDEAKMVATLDSLEAEALKAAQR
jgi:hypothetical protein